MTEYRGNLGERGAETSDQINQVGSRNAAEVDARTIYQVESQIVEFVSYSPPSDRLPSHR
jgi:hypothetical protein